MAIYPSMDMQITKTADEFACDCCGACCRTFPILVSIGDAAREPRIREQAMELPEWQQNEEWHYRLHPLPFLEACPFQASGGLCAVYETRPDPCRRFRAGSESCTEARKRVGLQPLLPQAGVSGMHKAGHGDLEEVSELS